jgi:hypothetical protein
VLVECPLFQRRIALAQAFVRMRITTLFFERRMTSIE